MDENMFGKTCMEKFSTFFQAPEWRGTRFEIKQTGEPTHRRHHGDHMTFDEFDAFYATTPEHERWELVAGKAAKLPQPTIVHQRIVGNVSTMLKQATRTTLLLYVDRGVGVRDRTQPTFALQPDIIIGGKATTPDQIWTEYFYVAVEVVAPDEDLDLLALKFAFYQRHAHCEIILLFQETRLEVEIMHKSINDTWHKSQATGTKAPIWVSGLGDIGPLVDAYSDTPIHPTQAT